MSLNLSKLIMTEICLLVQGTGSTRLYTITLRGVNTMDSTIPPAPSCRLRTLTLRVLHALQDSCGRFDFSRVVSNSLSDVVDRSEGEVDELTGSVLTTNMI